MRSQHGIERHTLQPQPVLAWPAALSSRRILIDLLLSY
jgi:hypothetical protein